jgi:hypothetical protein
MHLTFENLVKDDVIAGLRAGGTGGAPANANINALQEKVISLTRVVHELQVYTIL